MLRRILLMFLVLSLFALAGFAYPEGMTGYVNTGCNCHGNAASPSILVSIKGPDVVTAGRTYSYTVEVNSLRWGGVNVKASSGKLNPGPGLQEVGGELTHRNSERRVWNFTWTAPAGVSGNVMDVETIWAVGLSVDGDGTNGGDAWARGSLEVQVLPGDDRPPSVPRNLEANLTPAGVRLTWSPSTDNVRVAGYLVYRRETGTLRLLGGTNQTSFLDPKVEEGGVYSYRVSAFDFSNNTSPRTDAVSVEIKDSTPPSLPENVTAKAEKGGGGGVVLTWQSSTDNVGVAGYRVERSRDGRDFMVLASVNTSGYLDLNVSEGEFYYYRLRAFDGEDNYSPYTRAVRVEVGDSTPPGEPAGFKAVPEDGGVVLTWRSSTDNVGVAGYRVERSRGGVGEFSEIGVLDADATSYLDESVEAGASYSYRLQAFDLAGNPSVYSRVLEVELEVPEVKPGIWARILAFFRRLL